MGGRRGKILLVDDDIDITFAFKVGLEQAGFVVDAYNDPTEALSAVEPGKYDIAIFDIRMPKMNGFQMYRQFRKLDGTTDVCFFTAFDIHESEFRKLFPEIDAKAFFSKPISIGEFVGRVNGLVDAH